MKSLSDYSNPFDAVRDFEKQLESFTGAPYAIVTDCCTHAIEIVLRIQRPEKLFFPSRTYLSVIMLMHKIGIDYELTDQSWFTDRRYKFEGSNVWDCARYLKPGMYQSNEIQCLSFNRGKPLAIGRGGAILTDNAEVAARANRMRYDGRDIFKYKNWIEQRHFEIGFHYYLRPEECVIGKNLLLNRNLLAQTNDMFSYPDCRQIKING
jgi:dTDP-4-amino-4,6-dideoxygalactose transaminase